jgi:hypothetical protein
VSERSKFTVQMLLLVIFSFATAHAAVPIFLAEVHSATDGAGSAFNNSTLSLNVTGTNTLLIVAWHSEFDAGFPDSWKATDNGVAGTEIVETNGYSNPRCFRIYYWLNPPTGTHTIKVSNPSSTANELSVSAVLFSGVSQSNPLATPVLNVSTSARTGESETAATSTNDLVVHVIADALLTRGTLGTGETSASIANDGHHPQDGDASLWVSTKPGAAGTTTVSSSGWANRTINAVAIALHGAGTATGPAAPTNLAASGGIGTVDLTWIASTSSNVSGYNVYRGTAPGVSPVLANRIGQPSATSFVDTTLTASGTYYYVVTAQDSSGNQSTASNEVSIAVSPDASIPTPPIDLKAIAISNNKINLSWTASSDDVAVTGYDIERCKNAGCKAFRQFATSTATTYISVGLAPLSSYSYRIRATDGVGNLSGYSNIATATTLPTPPPPIVPAFIQVNSATPQSSVASVMVPYTGVQTAGNLDVVIVGWSDNKASVTSVTDTKGNVYNLAVGPTLGAGITQAIYYSANIGAAAAGANQVKVTFSPAATTPDVRVLEYSGIDPANPLDTTAAMAGKSINSNSGLAVTTNARDLLVAANTVQSSTDSATSGFVSRIITSPDGDLAADRFITKAASYRATAKLDSSGVWVMQIVAFRAAVNPAP